MSAAVAADIAEELGFGLSASPDVDQRVILTGITWQQYEILLALFGDDPPGIRVASLEGKLEIMSPSRKHERIEKMFGRLVELYALERDIPLIGLGSATFRDAAKERGVEPHECYWVGDEKEFPDLAFEVSGGLDKLAIYGGLGVPEAWFWRSRGFLLFGLEGSWLSSSRAQPVPAGSRCDPPRRARRGARPTADGPRIPGRAQGGAPGPLSPTRLGRSTRGTRRPRCGIGSR